MDFSPNKQENKRRVSVASFSEEPLSEETIQQFLEEIPEDEHFQDSEESTVEELVPVQTPPSKMLHSNMDRTPPPPVIQPQQVIQPPPLVPAPPVALTRRHTPITPRLRPAAEANRQKRIADAKANPRVRFNLPGEVPRGDGGGIDERRRTAGYSTKSKTHGKVMARTSRAIPKLGDTRGGKKAAKLGTKGSAVGATLLTLGAPRLASLAGKASERIDKRRNIRGEKKTRSAAAMLTKKIAQEEGLERPDAVEIAAQTGDFGLESNREAVKLEQEKSREKVRGSLKKIQNLKSKTTGRLAERRNQKMMTEDRERAAQRMKEDIQRAEEEARRRELEPQRENTGEDSGSEEVRTNFNPFEEK